MVGAAVGAVLMLETRAGDDSALMARMGFKPAEIKAQREIEKTTVRTDGKPSAQQSTAASETQTAAAAAEREKARQNLFSRAVLERTVLPGMSAEQCIAAWGKPKEINQTVTASHVTQQWVFSSDRYLYLENGVLQSIRGSVVAPEPASTPTLTMHRSW